ncbi:hypothetical protein D9613_001239 [Agrocybe pediades]|uniref:Uncharacterized protein n=1 Tax=Agrocybe pediades TaxID=84607 RepID=A0A8H4R1S6_9AGAR|nr:hypothetical protein D9613_001239 [Agrocybe pediades]
MQTEQKRLSMIREQGFAQVDLDDDLDVIRHLLPSPQVRDDQNRPFAASTSYEEGDPTSSARIHPPWKRILYKLLEQPTSSSSAFARHMLATFLNVFSAFITVLEPTPAVHSISGLNPSWWMIFICLRIVDLPDSPESVWGWAG